LAYLDLKSNKRPAYRLPKGDVVSEPIFIPRTSDAQEEYGYLLAAIYCGAERRIYLAPLDPVSSDTGPITHAQLSHRVVLAFIAILRPDAGNFAGARPVLCH
jgi:carotenoid cleavage dioxygenase